MANKREYVGCICGWRGKRVYRPCECDYDYGCVCGPHYGYCPKCGYSGVRPVKEEREWRKRQAEADAFWASDEGKALMASLAGKV